MISWKYFFETASGEVELVKKKKRALDTLLDTGRISRATYEYINKELTEAIAEAERRQREIADRITSRASDLEKQVQTLEMFLASLEIHHAAGEVEEESYRHQANAVTLGLEATKQELANIKGILLRLIPEETPAPPPPAPPAPPTLLAPAEEKTEEPMGTALE